MLPSDAVPSDVDDQVLYGASALTKLAAVARGPSAMKALRLVSTLTEGRAVHGNPRLDPVDLSPWHRRH